MRAALAARAAQIMAATAILAGCAAGPVRSPSPADPYERFNRSIYNFNDHLDRAVLKPVAKGYKKVIPQPARTGVGNFIANLETPKVMINDALQGRFKDSGSDLGRFLVNSTLGIGGLFDVATKMHIDHNDQDFGRTLGVWGVKSGPYLVLPLFGPSTFRDAPGRLVDTYLNPIAYYHNTYAKWSYAVVAVVHKRYELLSYDPTLEQAFDPYALLRDAYLQKRRYEITGESESDEELLDPDAPPAR